MKKNILLLTALCIMQLTAMAQQTDTLTVRIKAMRCGDCAHKVMTAVRALPGIESVKSNLERRTTTVVYNAALTSADSICARLEATKRFRPTAYSPTDIIKRGFGLRMDDMHCQNCANRIVKRLEKMEGIDSLAPHVDKHYVFIRYDANRTCKDTIRQALNLLGYTPVNYYSGPKVSFAYYNIPPEQATETNMDEVLMIEAVDDVNVNARRKSMAVTYFNEEITADSLLQHIRKAGIDAQVPPPHECKEEKEKQL